MDTRGKRNNRDFTKGILTQDQIDLFILPHLSPYEIQSLKLAHHKALSKGDELLRSKMKLPKLSGDIGGITKTPEEVEDLEASQDDINDVVAPIFAPNEGRYGRYFYTQPPNVPFGVIREHPNFYDVNLDRGDFSGEANEQILNLY